MKNLKHDLLENIDKDKVLTVNLTYYWFDKFVSGFKKEEYRKITDHWIKRLLKEPLGESVPKFKEFEYLEIRKGYTRNRIIYKITDMAIRHPKPDWAPEEWLNERCFVIETGRKVYRVISL